jgi:hypothetical protein
MGGPVADLRPGFPVTVAGYAPYGIDHPFRAVVVREGNEGVFVGFSYGGPITTDVVEVPAADLTLDVAVARGLAASLTEAIAAATHRPSPRPGHYRFSPPDGDPVRVVIAGDVIALPEEGWSLGGFGRSISEEWLLTQPRPRIPGTKARRLVLVACIRAALEEHYRVKAGGTGGEGG